MENSYVFRCEVRHAYGLSFGVFFNEWLEGMGLCEISSRSPNCTDSLTNFTVTILQSYSLWLFDLGFSEI